MTLQRDYDMDCSIARTLEMVGERWTLLVIRDVFLGNRRFDEIQNSLGIARNVLANRLDRLIDEEILEKRAYTERPPRHEYFLTEKGLDLWPILIAAMGFGDKHCPSPSGAPMVIRHRGCGGIVNDRRICGDCGAEVGVREAEAEGRLVEAATT